MSQFRHTLHLLLSLLSLLLVVLDCPFEYLCPRVELLPVEALMTEVVVDCFHLQFFINFNIQKFSVFVY